MHGFGAANFFDPSKVLQRFGVPAELRFIDDLACAQGQATSHNRRFHSKFSLFCFHLLNLLNCGRQRRLKVRLNYCAVGRNNSFFRFNKT